MGTSRSASELAAKFGKAASGMGAANSKAVGEAAFIYKEILLAEGRKDSGGDLRLSRGGAKRGGQPKGIPLTARYDVKGRENAQALLKATPQGPWKWLEVGTKAHPIVPKTTRRQQKFAAGLAGLTGTAVGAGVLSAGRRGKRRGGVVLIGGDTPRAYANHPGSKGKRTWSRSLKKAEPGAMRTFRAAHTRALIDVFGA